MTKRGNKYVGEKKRGTAHLKSEKTVFSPSLSRKTESSFRIRRPLDLSDFAPATITPGKIPPGSPVDINTFHTSHGHVHETVLHSTAKQLGIVV